MCHMFPLTLYFWFPVVSIDWLSYRWCWVFWIGLQWRLNAIEVFDTLDQSLYIHSLKVYRSIWINCMPFEITTHEQCVQNKCPSGQFRSFVYLLEGKGPTCIVYLFFVQLYVTFLDDNTEILYFNILGDNMEKVWICMLTHKVCNAY